MLLLLLGCYSFDDVPIVEGAHCAPDTVGYVVNTLDGDTIDVVTSSALQVGTAAPADDTGGEDTASGGGTDEGETQILRIRMLGVDAPEIAHNSTEVADCYGDLAAGWTHDTVLGRQVILSFDHTCTDKYDRALAYVFLTKDGATYDLGDCTSGSCVLPSTSTPSPVVLINDVVIRYGYARVYEDFDDIRLADVLYDAQKAAQNGNKGLWSTCE
jgi:endonuclease YncB( thermonuclease family)